MSLSSGQMSGPGRLYAPLRQLVTDSESEDEYHNRTERTLRVTENCTHLDINSGLHVKSTNYSLSDIDELNTNPNTVDTTMDNVSFLQSDTSNKMSLTRKISFVASILLCILTVVAFLWFIPCSETAGCSATEWRDRTTSWELPYDDIELSGSVQVVDGAQANSKNLIFIYRGNHMKNQTSNHPVDNGVLLIVGNSGKVGWYTREYRIPTQIDCHLLDVNADGRKDCLVAGSEGLLAAINPLSGTFYWYLQSQRNKTNIIAIDFPVTIKDLDGDRVDDLLISATILPNTDHNSLLLVSGATGHVVGEPLAVGECAAVHNIVVNSSHNITYSCRRNASESLRVITYNQLKQSILKPAHDASHHSAPVHKTHLNLTLKKNIGNTINFFKNGKGKLMMENSGECPDNCRVSVKLVLEKNGTVWQYSANHVYGVRPSSFSFANSIHGFVLKL